LARRKTDQLRKIEEEKAKLEHARGRLRQKVMARIEQKKAERKASSTANELHTYNPPAPPISETEEDTLAKEQAEKVRLKEMRKRYKSRHETFLKSIYETRLSKQM
jgi:hypothetical protein